MHDTITRPEPIVGTLTGGSDPLNQLSQMQRAMFGYLADYDGLTRKLYEFHLKTFMTWCLEHHIDPMTADRTHVAVYVRHCHEGLGHKASTVSSELTPVRGFYKWCFLEGVIDKDPAAHVRLPKVHFEQKQPLTKDELREIRAAGKDLGGRHWALAELLIVQAMRISECRGLLIENYQDTERGPTCGPHLLRASVITDQLEDGLSLREAQWLAGHSDPRVTSKHYDLGWKNHARHPSHVVSARLTA